MYGTNDLSPTNGWTLRAAARKAVAHLLSGVLAYQLQRMSHGHALILAYHRINTRDYLRTNHLMPGMYISVEAFIAHVEWLRTRYQMVSLNEIVTRIQRKTAWDVPCCAITFDDGWHDNLEHAVPVLQRLQIPATIFIVGDRIGVSEPDDFHLCFELLKRGKMPPLSGAGCEKIDQIIGSSTGDFIGKSLQVLGLLRTLPLDRYNRVFASLRTAYRTLPDVAAIGTAYQTLSWDDMRKMQGAGIDFGYHSRGHDILPRLAARDLIAAVTLPDEEAARHGVALQRTFCYPDGAHNDAVIASIRETNYACAVTLIPGLNDINTDPYRLRRFNVHEGAAASPAELCFTLMRALKNAG